MADAVSRLRGMDLTQDQSTKVLEVLRSIEALGFKEKVALAMLRSQPGNAISDIFNLKVIYTSRGSVSSHKDHESGASTNEKENDQETVSGGTASESEQDTDGERTPRPTRFRHNTFNECSGRITNIPMTPSAFEFEQSEYATRIALEFEPTPPGRSSGFADLKTGLPPTTLLRSSTFGKKLVPVSHGVSTGTASSGVELYDRMTGAPLTSGAELYDRLTGAPLKVDKQSSSDLGGEGSSVVSVVYDRMTGAPLKIDNRPSSDRRLEGSSVMPVVSYDRLTGVPLKAD